MAISRGSLSLRLLLKASVVEAQSSISQVQSPLKPLWCWLQPVQIVDSDPFAGLDDYFPAVETAATIDSEAGPSSLALKENMQPSTGRVSANTRGQQRPGLVDTRSIEVPVLKNGEGFFASKLRSAASKGGTEPGSFYGSKGMQQTPVDDSSAPTVRQSSRVQKRKAEQVVLSTLSHQICCHSELSCPTA